MRRKSGALKNLDLVHPFEKHKIVVTYIGAEQVAVARALLRGVCARFGWRLVSTGALRCVSDMCVGCTWSPRARTPSLFASPYVA